MTAMLGLMNDRPVSALLVESDWKASLERAEVLVQKGWSVSVSVSAEDALARLEGSVPDVVLTDLALSGDMTGLDSRAPSEAGRADAVRSSHRADVVASRGDRGGCVGRGMRVVSRDPVLGQRGDRSGHERDRDRRSSRLPEG